MSVNTTRSTVSRQWELLKRLPTRSPGLTARDLTQRLNQDGFAVSKRQVERDLNELSVAFAICCNDKSVPYGWYWAKGASADLPAMTGAEALSTYMMQEVVTPLLPSSVLEVMSPRFQQAKERLESISTQSVLPSWKDKVASVSPNLPQLPPTLNESALEAIQTALLHSKQVDVRYFVASKNQLKNYTLHPLGLVQRGVVTYLVACVDPYPDPHLFAMQRMEWADMRTEDAIVPEGFSLKEYLKQGGMQFSEGQTISLRALIERTLVQSLQESPISADQTIAPCPDSDLWSELNATVVNSWQLRWWVLSMGAMIQIVSPVTLKNDILSNLKQAVGNYDTQ